MLEEGGFKKKLILASASPRRKKVLELLKLDFEVIKPEDFEEERLKDPYRTVVQNSIAKARSVYNYLKKREHGGESKSYPGRFLIAGFDTIIYINRRILGKPSGMEEKYIYDTETTQVKFRKLTMAEIEKYVNKEVVTDKAGAYDVSGYGSLLVEKINGCFFNIAGFPVSRFVDLLGKSGFNVID